LTAAVPEIFSMRKIFRHLLAPRWSAQGPKSHVIQCTDGRSAGAAMHTRARRRHILDASMIPAADVGKCVAQVEAGQQREQQQGRLRKGIGASRPGRDCGLD
jgi:hypothetical protein